MNVELWIENNGHLYQPVVEEGITWSTERKSVPGQLTFNILHDDHILYDDNINFSEGNAVRLRIDGNNIFYGYIFSKKCDKEKIITITAYDQLRYLKNKDSFIYENKTASQFIKMVANDFFLKVGTIEDTGFIIPSRIEDNTSLFDMIGNALDLTLTNKKEMFVLYDDFGKLTLKSIANMKIHSGNDYLVIDEETGENFDYTSSIDSNTYNTIKLDYENEDTGKRDTFIKYDINNINSWGVLQYYDTLKKGENGNVKAEALLKLYNNKTRNLSITNAIGDTRVRAGSMIVVNLNLGDMKLHNFMLVEKAKHTFKENEHWMDLTLRGGEFVA